MKIATAAALLILILTASVLLLAQGPPPPPDPATRVQHQVQWMTTLLSLTTAQQQQATTIFTNASSAEMSVLDQLKTARQSLNTAILGNNSDSIDQIAASIGGLMAQMTSIGAKAQASFYQILTADQQSKLTQLQSEGPMGLGFTIGTGFMVGPPGFVMSVH